MDVVGASITALLGPERANKNEIQFAANEIIEFLRRAQAAAIEFIDSPKAPT